MKNLNVIFDHSPVKMDPGTAEFEKGMNWINVNLNRVQSFSRFFTTHMIHQNSTTRLLEKEGSCLKPASSLEILGEIIHEVS